MSASAISFREVVEREAILKVGAIPKPETVARQHETRTLMTTRMMKVGGVVRIGGQKVGDVLGLSQAHCGRHREDEFNRGYD